MKKRLVVTGGITVLIVGVAVGTAFAASGGEIHACVNPGGMPRVVSGELECKSQETHLVWNIVGPQGERGPQGEIGPQGPSGQVGPIGERGEIGPAGEPGLAGVPGTPGLSCWDLNGNGIADPEDDVNLDGIGSALDCRGAQGQQGFPGPQGEPGAPGAGIASFNDLNGIPCKADDMPGVLSVSFDWAAGSVGPGGGHPSTPTPVAARLGCALLACMGVHDELPELAFDAGDIASVVWKTVLESRVIPARERIIRIEGTDPRGMIYEIRLVDVFERDPDHAEGRLDLDHVGSGRNYDHVPDAQLAVCMAMIEGALAGDGVECSGDFCAW